MNGSILATENIPGYRFEGEIGRGGMGAVYKAVDEKDGRLVAIKLLHTTSREEAAFARFEREAIVLQKLRHPHIVHLYDFALNKKTPYLVMEFIEGTTLEEHINQFNSKTPVNPTYFNQTLQVVSQVANALAYTHRNQIFHRDIKPTNIMVEKGSRRAVVMDFGIAKLTEPQLASLTVTGSFLGTPSYIAPERTLGNPGDQRADIYSLGVVLFELFTGQLPYTAETLLGLLLKLNNEAIPHPSDVNPHIPARLETLIMKAMAKDPEERYQSIEVMEQALSTMIGIEVVGSSNSNQDQAQLVAEQREPETAVSSGPPLVKADFTTTTLGVPYQTPPRLQHFNGRDALLSRLKKSLRKNNGTQIIGLVGFGGVGKSALAIEAVHQLKAAFPDGILWAQLDAVLPEAELKNFATAFGQGNAISEIQDLAGKAAFVRQLLSDKKVLVVLDQASTSEQIKWLLPNGLENKTLITTRNGKMLARLGADVIPVPALDDEESRSFLIAFLGQERVEREKSAAQRIGEQVGRLPLALSIVAGSLAEAEDLGLAEYATMLEDEQSRFEHLSDWEDTTRSMAASIELSYQALSPELQRLFNSLAVFDGPDFDSRAVAVVTGQPASRVKIWLGRLYFLSLLSAGIGHRDGIMPVEVNGHGRYRLNPLIKIFAKQKLGNEESNLRQRAATYFVNLARENQGTTDYLTLDLEWPNIEGALHWAGQQSSHELLVQGLLALTHYQDGTAGFIDVRGYWQQAQALLDRALVADAPSPPPHIRAELLTNLALFHLRQSNHKAAAPLIGEAMTLAESLPQLDTTLLLKSRLHEMSAQLLLQENRSKALEHVEQAIDLLKGETAETVRRQRGFLQVQRAAIQIRLGHLNDALVSAQHALTILPDTPSAARLAAQINIGNLSYRLGKTSESTSAYNQAFESAKVMGHTRYQATILLMLGLNEERRGNLARAIEYQEKALRYYRFMGDTYYELGIANNLGDTYTKLRDNEKARTHLESAVTGAVEHQLKDIEATAKTNLAKWTLLQQDISRTNRLLAEASAISDTLQLAYLKPSILRIQAQCLQAQADVPVALERIEEAITLAKASQDVEEEGICWRIKGELAWAQKKLRAAAEAFDQSLTLLSEQDIYQYGRTLLALGRLNHETQNSQDARQQLQEAAELFTTLGTQHELEQSKTLLEAIKI